MKHDGLTVQHIRDLAADEGLALRGWFRIREDDRIPRSAACHSLSAMLLFGQTGSDMWDRFSQSPEYADGNPNPMDRWSRRIGCAIAEKLGGIALFPFEGPPWHPFGQWAQRAESIRSSPLGILMHPRYGLWHAYRFAIAIRALDGHESSPESSTERVESSHHACDTCNQQPCLTACPVGAFSNGEYQVQACAEFLRNNQQADCHSLGCRARGACPEGRDYTYDIEHRQFHMREFYRALAATVE